MRSIHLVTIDKVRPALVLTREVARPYLTRVTVVPITSTVRGLSTELLLGVSNGLDHECVANFDGVTTIPVGDLGKEIGLLLDAQESALTEAIAAAYDLDLP